MKALLFFSISECSRPPLSRPGLQGAAEQGSMLCTDKTPSLLLWLSSSFGATLTVSHPCSSSSSGWPEEPEAL